jgi:hypothetical protein
MYTTANPGAGYYGQENHRRHNQHNRRNRKVPEPMPYPQPNHFPRAIQPTQTNQSVHCPLWLANWTRVLQLAESLGQSELLVRPDQAMQMIAKTQQHDINSQNGFPNLWRSAKSNRPPIIGLTKNPVNPSSLGTNSPDSASTNSESETTPRPPSQVRVTKRSHNPYSMTQPTVTTVTIKHTN